MNAASPLGLVHRHLGPNVAALPHFCLLARANVSMTLLSAPVTNEFDIDSLRDEIDDIDSQILTLVVRRVTAVLKIGEYKRARGLPIYDAERERAVIQRLTQASPPELDSQVVRRVFERIIDESRRVEQHRTGEQTE